MTINQRNSCERGWFLSHFCYPHRALLRPLVFLFTLAAIHVCGGYVCVRIRSPVLLVHFVLDYFTSEWLILCCLVRLIFSNDLTNDIGLICRSIEIERQHIQKSNDRTVMIWNSNLVIHWWCHDSRAISSMIDQQPTLIFQLRNYRIIYHQKIVDCEMSTIFQCVCASAHANLWDVCCCCVEDLSKWVSSRRKFIIQLLLKTYDKRKVFVHTSAY